MPPKIRFVFNIQEYHRNNSTVPPLVFTCSTFADNTLPPYLKFCLKLTTFLRNQKGIQHFLEPVSELVPGYYEIIKHPMCVSVIEKKIYEGQYPNVDSFKADVDLIWSNCITFNSLNHGLTQIGLKIKSSFDELFELHKKIENPEEALAALQLMDDAYSLSDTCFNSSHSSMQIFRMPPHPKATIARPRQSQSGRYSRYPKGNENKEDNGYVKPSDDLLNTPMTTKEKYDMAKYIDTLPPELLGKVIEILSEKFEIPKDREVDIPFSEIDNATLRNIEAYIKVAKDKEQLVRRMYQSETIPAEKQLEILNEELKRITARLAEKRPSSSAFSSETEGTDDSSTDTNTDTSTTSTETETDSESDSDES
ncbi:bromodomain-containing protein 3-like isoform X1 [Histomonas meleagridis]|uniref:bromodomain-containing protein 3-like isoform X1 n=1 Tax=Histomonas meleagridis TaxID=135588 RepID=UPI003559695B|nr:bromodomain-containing protein 3-like isoform X1 [Histomonas meleagridis]KAH0798697.1 bromodomain-containing protein 3-like isoform X1 [Histomonas meleagridis]